MPGKQMKTGKGSRSQRYIGPRRRKYAAKHEVTCILFNNYIFTQDSLETLYQQLQTANLSEKWFILFSPHEIQCFTVSLQFQSENPPLSFSKVLLIQQELSWKLLVENHELTTFN